MRPKDHTVTHALLGNRERLGWRGSAFTLIELLTVISIIGVLAAIGVGLAGVAVRKSREARIRAELNALVTAIESYKAAFGHYPPDNSLNGTNFNPAVHQLYYELGGTITAQQGVSNRPLAMMDWVSYTTLSNSFHMPGIVNSAETPNQPRNYLLNTKRMRVDEAQMPGASEPIKMLTLPFEWRERSNPAFPWLPTQDPRYKNIRRLNPWRYVSTNPTNNPGRFDLWAVFILGKQTNLIANW